MRITRNDPKKQDYKEKEWLDNQRNKTKKKKTAQYCMWLNDVKRLVHAKRFIRRKVGRKMLLIGIVHHHNFLH